MRAALSLLVLAPLFLAGCPKAVPISELELESLTVTAASGSRYCLSSPPQLLIQVTSTDGKSYRTPRRGEGHGNRLRFQDFHIETSHGSLTEDGVLLIDDPIPLLHEELVVRVRPAGATGPGTATPDWVKDELRLYPRFDCRTELNFDGSGGAPGNGGSWGEHGLEGKDGGDEEKCTAAQNGRSGQNGGDGQNGADGRDGADVRVDIAVAHSSWRHRVLVLRATGPDLPTPRYVFLDPNLIAQVVVSAQGGPGGPGGDGGRGGNGGNGGDSHCNNAAAGNGGDGGDGGDGGNGGNGGDGGRIDLFAPVDHTEVVEWFALRNGAGYGGTAGGSGSSGDGGRAGTGPMGSAFPGKDGRYGSDATAGRDGNVGPAVNISFADTRELFAKEILQGLQLR